MQTLYGVIPNIYAKGKCAKMVAEQILRMRRELSSIQEPQITSKIDNLIIIDRSVDMITPMMTQLTYEGMIDENIGIKYSLNFIKQKFKKTFHLKCKFYLKAQFEIPQDRIKKSNSPDAVNVVEMKKSIVILNSADSLFSEMRDRNFQSINQVLSRTAKELQQANEVN